jgi:hypothetical protein
LVPLGVLVLHNLLLSSNTFVRKGVGGCLVDDENAQFAPFPFVAPALCKVGGVCGDVAAGKGVQRLPAAEDGGHASRSDDGNGVCAMGAGEALDKVAKEECLARAARASKKDVSTLLAQGNYPRLLVAQWRERGLSRVVRGRGVGVLVVDYGLAGGRLAQRRTCLVSCQLHKNDVTHYLLSGNWRLMTGADMAKKA